MPDCGRRRKTKTRFPAAAHESLEIATAISTFPQPRRPLPRGKVEIQKQDSHFPTLFFPSQIKKPKGASIKPAILVLQAHLRIGKRSFARWYLVTLQTRPRGRRTCLRRWQGDRGVASASVGRPSGIVTGTPCRRHCGYVLSQVSGRKENDNVVAIQGGRAILGSRQDRSLWR
jgi:hypothetical protein